MPRKRNKQTGYGVLAMKRRLESIADELLLMAEDGRQYPDIAHKTRAHVFAAMATLDEGLARYRRDNKKT